MGVDLVERYGDDLSTALTVLSAVSYGVCAFTAVAGCALGAALSAGSTIAQAGHSLTTCLDPNAVGGTSCGKSVALSAVSIVGTAGVTKAGGKLGTRLGASTIRSGAVANVVFDVGLNIPAATAGTDPAPTSAPDGVSKPSYCFYNPGTPC